MTLRPHYETPCWEIIGVASRRPPQEQYGEGWPHYRTREAAEANLAEEVDHWDVTLTVAESFGGPCLGVFCDYPECGEEWDLTDEGCTHLDPADPFPVNVDECDWFETEDEKRHYCPRHTPPWCEDCDGQHYPDDVCPEAPPKPAPIPMCDGQLALVEVDA